jgi:membrane protein
MQPVKEETVARHEAADQPVGELVQQLSQQTATLVRKEIRLAQLELQEKGKHAGIGVGMFGSSGLVALYGLGVLITAAVLGLSTAVDGWLAALIVAVVLFAVAGVLALTGKKQVEQATPPKPEAAMDSVHADIDEVKERAGRS